MEPADNRDDDIKKNRHLSDTSLSSSTPRSIDIEPFLNNSVNSISDLSTLRVSSLGSTPVSTSQVSPPLATLTPIQEPEIKTRRPLPDKAVKLGKLCCFTANKRDLSKIEDALRCRLISNLEFDCLKIKRAGINETFHLLYDIREILLLLRSDNEDERSSSSVESGDNQENNI